MHSEVINIAFRVCGIYMLMTPKGDFYIGSSSNIRRRLCDHFRRMRAGKHYNIALQRAFNKYGTLSAGVVLVCRQEDMLMYEQIAINGLKPRLNCSKLAGKVEHNDEVRAKLRAAAIAQMSDPAARESLSVLARQQWEDPVKRERMTSARRGIKISPDAKVRQSTGLRAYWSSPEADARRAALSKRTSGNKYRQGVTHTEETKRKIGAAGIGRTKSPECRAKISATKRARCALIEQPAS